MRVGVSDDDLFEVGHAANDFIDGYTSAVVVFVGAEREVLLLPVDALAAIVERPVGFVEVSGLLEGYGLGIGHQLGARLLGVVARRQALRSGGRWRSDGVPSFEGG